MDAYSQALGYGFWCGKKCAERKIAAGIPPLGAKRAAKKGGADAEQTLAQAALEAQRPNEGGWSPLATAGVAVASLVAIGLMVVLIKKAKAK